MNFIEKVFYGHLCRKVEVSIPWIWILLNSRRSVHSFEAKCVHSKLDLRNQRGIGCCEAILLFPWDVFLHIRWYLWVVPQIISSRTVSKDLYWTFCGFILLSERPGAKSENFWVLLHLTRGSQQVLDESSTYTSFNGTSAPLTFCLGEGA